MYLVTSMTMPMNEFDSLAYGEIYDALTALDTGCISDIYAISFYVSDLEDDPRRPILQLGYNTHARLAECTPAEGQAPGRPVASNTQEAQWNFAFWLQNELRIIGDPETEGGQRWEALLKARGLWYSDEDEAADFGRCEEIGSEITAFFIDTCVQIAQALHANGVIARLFPRTVPIIVHGLEYYDQIAFQTRSANPPGLAGEFEDWIARLCVAA